MPVVSLEYIEVDDRGVAKLIGTRTKVRQVVMDVQSGMTPEQIHEQYPHLSLSQIHAALAYYYDHKAAIDEEIAEGIRFAEEMRAQHPNRLTREEWVARWKARCPDRPVPGETDEQTGSP
jgi:uncharacterized protein (DUF433 family)